LGHQISYGILLFARGKNNFHDIGGKAWLNSLIPLSDDKRGLFVDDSRNHYESTKSMGINNLDCHVKQLSCFLDEIFDLCHLFTQRDNLYKLLNKYA